MTKTPEFTVTSQGYGQGGLAAPQEAEHRRSMGPYTEQDVTERLVYDGSDTFRDDTKYHGGHVRGPSRE